MSAMKFRRTCSACNATFFSPDRKASLCLKCSKKKIVKHVPAAAAPVRTAAPPVRVVPKPAPRPAMPRKAKTPRAPKSASLTPETRQRILAIYEQEYSDQEGRLREVHAEIADKLWVKRQVVAEALRDVHQAKTLLTADLKQRAIEMYRRFVESGHRPEGGRRRAISVSLGAPYKQVMNLIREWSLGEYAQSPTPSPTRQQLFEIEKAYWEELNKRRYGLTEMPSRISEQLGYVTKWQVLRWLDVLHDDERAFSNVPDPPEETQQQIIDAYKDYLLLESPPEHGLHYTVARQIGKVTPRQVHKVLQNYRHKMRTEYPLV
jgi:hypothetical protein